MENRNSTVNRFSVKPSALLRTRGARSSALVFYFLLRKSDTLAHVCACSRKELLHTAPQSKIVVIHIAGSKEEEMKFAMEKTPKMTGFVSRPLLKGVEGGSAKMPATRLEPRDGIALSRVNFPTTEYQQRCPNTL